MVWRVATTGSQAEFAAANELRAEGLDVFLPYVRGKVRVRLPTRGRAVYKAEVRETPRWPRYLFVDDLGDAARVLAARTVRQLISFGGEIASVPESAVAEMRKGCDATGRVLRHSYLVGDILRLIAPSPMAGQRGVVLSLGEASLRLTVGAVTVTTPYGETAPTH